MKTERALARLASNHLDEVALAEVYRNASRNPPGDPATLRLCLRPDGIGKEGLGHNGRLQAAVLCVGDDTDDLKIESMRRFRDFIKDFEIDLLADGIFLAEKIAGERLVDDRHRPGGFDVVS